MQVVNGTYYHDRTPHAVISILETARANGTRLKLFYGDVKTGRLWGDVETGYIGRSPGPEKIPLAVYNRRSSGGPGILEHCIVRIETTTGRLLYDRARDLRWRTE